MLCRLVALNLISNLESPVCALMGSYGIADTVLEVGPSQWIVRVLSNSDGLVIAC